MEPVVQNECLLKRVEDQELAAREFGFYWEHVDQLLNQIRSECDEVREAWENGDRTHLQEEIGDLMQAAISLAIFFDLDPYKTLLKSVSKFQHRYDKVVELAKADGLDNLHAQSFETLLNDYWKRAKTQ